MVAKNAQLSASVPASVVFSEIISSENSTNYDVLYSLLVLKFYI